MISNEILHSINFETHSVLVQLLFNKYKILLSEFYHSNTYEIKLYIEKMRYYIL